MNHAFKSTSLIVTVLVASMLISGCGVTLQNMTAKTYPYESLDLVTKGPYLFTPTTPNAIIPRLGIAERGFYLEAKPKQFTSMRGVDVFVDGTRYSMSKLAGPSKGGLYHVDVPMTCQEEMTYYYNVRVRNFLSNDSKRLGDPQEPLRVKTSGWGHMYWYNPGVAPHLDDTVEPPFVIKLDKQTNVDSATVVVENLRPGRVAIYGFNLVDAAGTTHNDEFLLSGVPNNASGPLGPPASRVYLDCGDSVVLNIRHVGNTEGAVGAFTLLAANDNLDIVFNKLIFVQESDLTAP
ncbi:MAG: hypothetical protein K0U72_13460 [Gammaproteobacteria bacterium]|nr:hypothetical protein [Gammaproteobacteria bacterium]